MSRLILLCAFNFLIVVSSGYDNDNIRNKITWANARLTGRMLYNRVVTYPGDSVVVATLPIMALLLQAALHTKGNKYEELTQWFQVNTKDEFLQFKHFFPSLIREIQNDPDVSLTFAAFGDIRDPLSEEFKRNFKSICDGNIKYVDYNNVSGSTNRINAWFKDRYSKQYENVIDSGYLRNRGRGLVFVTNMNTLTSWDHPFNPKGLVEIEFKKTANEIQKLVALYGNAFSKYADLPSLKARMLMLPSKEGGVQNSIVILYPNDPSDLPSILNEMQDPSVFFEAIGQLRYMCLKLYLTTGQAHPTNIYSTHIPELELNLTELCGVKKNDCGSTEVFTIIQQLHLIADKDVREGPINTEECPDEEFPLLKVDHPFAYFVLNKYKSPIFAGVNYGY